MSHPSYREEETREIPYTTGVSMERQEEPYNPHALSSLYDVNSVVRESLIVGVIAAFVCAFSTFTIDQVVVAVAKATSGEYVGLETVEVACIGMVVGCLVSGAALLYMLLDAKTTNSYQLWGAVVVTVPVLGMIGSGLAAYNDQGALWPMVTIGVVVATAVGIVYSWIPGRVDAHRLA